MYMQTKNTLNLLLPITSIEYIYIKFQVCTSNFSTSVCGTSNEQVVATVASIIEGGTNASTGDVGALSGRTSYKQ